MPLRLTPRIALSAITLLTFAAWAVLGHAASVPRFFMDELYYMKAGVSLAQGRGLQFEGQAWGYGPVFPLLIAGFVKLTSTQEATYELVKLANSAFFALASIPNYLLARRVLPPWPSVAAVALAALVPSSMYSSVTMTESLGYLIACWALYTIVWALEQPSVQRQLVALGVSATAVATRPQLMAVFGSYLLALAFVAAVPSTRPSLRTLWPTGLAVVAGVAWIARPVVQGHGVGRSLGSYSLLARSYDVLQVAKWFFYEVGDLALYVGVVPMVVAPVVLSLWWKRARAGSRVDATLLLLFVTQNTIGVGLIAAFASTNYGLGILYDRYLFYLVPLWLILLVGWVHAGMPTPVRPLALGCAFALAVVATLPYGVVARPSWFQHFEAIATGVWGKVALVVARVPAVSVRAAAVFFVAVAVAAVIVSRGRAWLPIAVVVIALTSNLALAWRSAFVPKSAFGLNSSTDRGFVDARLGPNADVTLLSVHASCIVGGSTGIASLETDYFNRSVRRVMAANQGEGADNPSSLTVRADGSVFTRAGDRVTARYLLAPASLVFRGRRIEGIRGLWDVRGQVRLVNVDSDAQLFTTVCPD